MAFQPTSAGCVEVVLRFTIWGQKVILTIGICLPTSGTPTSGDLLTVASSVRTWATTSLMPLLSRDLALVDVQVTDTSSQTGAQVTETLDPPVLGSVNETALPSQVALTVTFRTLLRGRAYRGRNYVPGIPQTSESVQGLANGTFRDALVAAYEALPVQLNDDLEGLKHVVISRQLNNVKRAVAVGTDVISYSADTTYDTQRRRTIGRGQ